MDGLILFLFFFKSNQYRSGQTKSTKEKKTALQRGWLSSVPSHLGVQIMLSAEMETFSRRQSMWPGHPPEKPRWMHSAVINIEGVCLFDHSNQHDLFSLVARLFPSLPQTKWSEYSIWTCMRMVFITEPTTRLGALSMCYIDNVTQLSISVRCGGFSLWRAG